MPTYLRAVPWKAGYQINWITLRGSGFSSKLKGVLGRHAFSPALCLPALLIVVMACGNGARDFNVVIYVVCLQWCVLDCISSQKAHIIPPTAFIRGGVKSLLTLWPYQAVTIWGELTNSWMAIKGQLMVLLHLHLPFAYSICQHCHICVFWWEEELSPLWLMQSWGEMHLAIYVVPSSMV